MRVRIACLSVESDASLGAPPRFMSPQPPKLLWRIGILTRQRRGQEDFHVLEEDGLWVTQPSERMLRFFAGLAAVAVALAAECPTDFSATFADMHDGDQKTVAISGAAMTITPANNNETWVIAAELDPVWCNATIDFNVPGKPSPPPVDLTATAVFGSSAALGDGMLLWEFTDPSGTLVAGEPLYPLNMWIQLP